MVGREGERVCIQVTIITTPFLMALSEKELKSPMIMVKEE